jgi:hypothetical protein
MATGSNYSLRLPACLNSALGLGKIVLAIAALLIILSAIALWDAFR